MRVRRQPLADVVGGVADRRNFSIGHGIVVGRHPRETETVARVVELDEETVANRGKQRLIWLW